MRSVCVRLIGNAAPFFSRVLFHSVPCPEVFFSAPSPFPPCSPRAKARPTEDINDMAHTPPGWTEPETITIRPEAILPLDVVDRYLRGRLPHTEGPLEVVQFAGGHANLTYLVRFGEHEYVLRRPPSGPVAPGAYDMARE